MLLGKLLWCAATGCYVLAQGLPGLWFTRGGGQPEAWPGISLTVSGIFTLLGMWQHMVAWLANPFFIAGWALVGYRLFVAEDQAVRGWYLVWALLATACALSSYGIKSIWVDEAGHEGQVTQLGAGFYVWLASMLLLGAACSIANQKNQGLTF